MSLKRISKYLGRFWTGAEAAYGVIIAMTFTSTLRGLSEVAKQELYSTVVFTALFCCIAWGVADGFFYGWERNFNTRMQEKIVESARSDNEKKDLALSLLHEELDDSIMGTFDPTVRQRIYERIVEYLSKTDVEVKSPTLRIYPSIIFGTFLLSAGAGVIVLIPFFILGNLQYAITVSNILGVFVLFLVGYFRQYEKGLRRRLAAGTLAALLGVAIAVITVVLGG